jgi:hypothetical protein
MFTKETPPKSFDFIQTLKRFLFEFIFEFLRCSSKPAATSKAMVGEKGAAQSAAKHEEDQAQLLHRISNSVCKVCLCIARRGPALAPYLWVDWWWWGLLP